MRSVRRRPAMVVLSVTLAAAALAALAGSLTWTTITGTGAEAVPATRLSGFDVTRAPLLMAVIAVLALIVSRFSGVWIRRLGCVTVTLLGIGVIVVAFANHPDVAALQRMHPELLARYRTDVRIGVGPAAWIAGLAGALLATAGLAGLASVGAWRPAAPRYDRDPAEQRCRPEDPWQALDAGDDPTL